MALQPQPIDVRFVSGADTKTDDKNVLYTGFLELKNSRIDKIGAFIPRGGFDVQHRINSTGSPTYGITSDGEYTVVSYGRSTDLYSGARSAATGYAAPGMIKRIYGGDASSAPMSIAASSTHVCAVWIASDNSNTNRVGILVIEASTGAVVLQSTYEFGTTTLQVGVAYNGSDFILVRTNNSFDLQAYKVDLTSTQTPFGTVLTWAAAPTGTTSMRFALCAVSSNMYLAYAADDSASVSLQQITTSGTTLTGTTVAALTMGGAAKCISIVPTTSVSTAVVGVAAGTDNTHAKCAFFDVNRAQVGSTQTVATVGHNFERAWIADFGTQGGSTPVKYGWTYKTASNQIANQYIGFSSSSNSGMTSATQLGIQPLSSPIKHDINVLGLTESHTSATYGSQAMCSFLSGIEPFPVFRLAPDKNVGQTVTGEVRQLPLPVTVGSKIYIPSTLVTSTLGFTASTPSSGTLSQLTIEPGIQASIIEWDTTALGPSIIDRSNNQALYIGSNTCDLSSRVQSGIPYPEMTSNLTDDLSLVAGTLTGIVSYVFAKVHKSGAGVAYRTYSPIYTGNLSNHKLQYILKASEFNTDAYVELYRTEVDGSVFYLAATKYGPGTNTDDLTDAQLLTKALADINGGELTPAAIGSIRAVATWRDRIAFVDADEPTVIKFNRPAPAPAGTSWASGLTAATPAGGGDIIALKQMDAALYIFKSNRILALHGEPPGLTGENSSLNTPQVVFDGIGCSDARSVVQTTKGLLFKSSKGFYLIMRNQEIVFLGAGPYDDRTVTVTGAGVGEDQAEVYFSHSDGKIWVLNLDTNSWYEWVYSTNVRGLAMSKDRVLFVSDNDVIECSTSETVDTAYSGSTTGIAQDVQTGWIQLDGIRGYQRVQRLYIEAEVLSNCTFTVYIYTDKNDTPVQTVSVNTATLTLTGGRLPLDIHLAKQKCESMRFRFTTNQYGVALSGCTLIVGVKAGGGKSSALNY